MPIPRHALAGTSLVAALLFPVAVTPAPVRIESPTETLGRPENKVAVVEALAPAEAGAYRFEIRKALRGDSGGELVVRMEPEVLTRTVAGERYILGFTEVLSDPLRRGALVADPLGPRIVGLDDAGFALIEDTKPVRRLLETAGSTDVEDLERAVSAILDQLVREEPVACRIAAAELHLRRGLSGRLGGAAGEALDTAWRTSTGDSRARYHLLSVAAKETDALGALRAAGYAREILDGHGSRLELTSYDPLLVLTAARVLGEVGATEDLSRLEKHLYSNNTGIPKAALPSLAAIDREAAEAAARQALEAEDLNPETRRVLEVFLRTAKR